MDLVEAEAEEQPPDEDGDEEGYVEADPAGRFIRVRVAVLLVSVRVLSSLLGFCCCCGRWVDSGGG
jgi:hypothetical protein